MCYVAFQHVQSTCSVNMFKSNSQAYSDMSQPVSIVSVCELIVHGYVVSEEEEGEAGEGICSPDIALYLVSIPF